MNVLFSSDFRKKYHKAGSAIKNAFQFRLHLFMKNYHDPQLHNHELQGKYKGIRSINITGDWRALYTEKSKDGQTIVTFELLGTHSQLYK